MKNKGRRHKAGYSSDDFTGIGNCKGGLVVITRDITKMSNRN